MAKFAFLIHPLTLEDVWRPIPEARNKRPEVIRQFLLWMDPFETAYISFKTKAGVQLEGWFISVPMLPEDFITNEQLAIEKVLKAANLAKELGAEVLGLGAYTSVIGNSAQKLGDKIPLPITSGASYTVAASLEVTYRVFNQLGVPLKELSAAVVGATGAIGRVTSFLLSKDVKRLCLIARNLSRLEYVRGEILSWLKNRGIEAPVIEISTDLKLLSTCDLTIAATSSTGNLIKPEILPPGSVVCDVSLPGDVSQEVKRNRKDVLVIEGGLIKLPEIPKLVSKYSDSWEKLMGYPEGVVLACMAETMLMAAEGIHENYSIGRNISPEKVERMKKLAEKHGMEVYGVPDRDKLIPEDFLKVFKTLKRGISN